MNKYCCAACGHAFFYHRESREWQLLNPRRKRNLEGCTQKDWTTNELCACEHVVVGQPGANPLG